MREMNAYRVIDTFRASSLFAVLDPAQVLTAFPSVKEVRLRKPDGEILTLAVEKVAINPQGVVALVFQDDPAIQIPRESTVEIVRE